MPVLKLNDLEGHLLNNQEIVINPTGIVRSEKNIKTGVTYFGFKSKENENLLTNSNLYPRNCDYIINSDSLKEVQDKFPNPLFAIYCDIEQSEYYIKYCKKKQESFYPSIILLSLKKPLILRKTEVITLGSVFIEIKTEKNSLILTKLEVSKSGQTRESFSYDSDKISEVTIGRDKNCTLVINNSSLSRVSATIKFFKVPIKELLLSESSNKKKLYDQLIDCDNDSQTVIKYWELYDGTVTKPSTNGLWLFSSNSYSIYDGLIVRLGKSKFIINKIQVL
jgi:hypothetical protein